ncbi:hypothetical protein TH66_07230 [Carbonactinospora thermoautotrophica]|uniref:Uncharacterized protein n=1 Tax=Carbonactinospora thermoautotrophica TaxID=1469144 RepID=A0A132N2Y1_9ACTN|nr:hypothetical protein [Carbonactinospora thermoautotrophica]KWW99911.1 hypothetical protein LI90_1551 [Carbonactinospora thermoautotrophica]KWX04387.1 hypothetical protein TH66_07230 [Carbonactinospora thermoautotrophica]KWX09050.1 hypothetical protein TR74_11965 [Carbonactinospora thermoautotrophica]
MTARDWITTAEAAEILGISPRRMRQLSGRLGARLQPDNVLLWPRQAVEQERERRKKAMRPAEADKRSAVDLLREIAEDVKAIRRHLERGDSGDAP